MNISFGCDDIGTDGGNEHHKCKQPMIETQAMLKLLSHLIFWVLSHEKQEVGYYRDTWDGKDARGRQVSSGIYLVQMEAGTFSAVGKMLFLK